MKDSKALEILTDVVSDMDFVTNSRIRISAMLVIKNEIISIGSAMMKSHPFQKKYGRTEDSIFLHAEVNCIHKALRKINNFDNATLYICRLKYYMIDNNIDNKVLGYGMSCPCSGCFRAIVEFGIKRVVYTIDSRDLKFKTL